MKKVTVLIVNQAPLICNLLAVVLRQESDIDVIGTAVDVPKALDMADKCSIMLVDVDLPNNGALTLATEVGRKQPDTQVIITGVEKQPKTIIQYIEAGASGYILKEFTLDEMVAQIHSAAEGKAIADPDMVAEMMERLSQLADICADQSTLQKELESLSPRETEVLDLLSEGKSNMEIGEALHIEVGTVKNHVHSILKKLGVTNRRQAARFIEQAEKE